MNILKKYELKLISDWKATLRHAWSIKFNVLASITGTLELMAQSGMLGNMPLWIFAMVSIVSSLAAGGARVLAQKELSDAEPADKP